MAAPVVFSRTTRLGAPAASISLSSIPQTADHLLVLVKGRSTVAGVVDGTFTTFNSDSGANYDSAVMEWDDDQDITGPGDDGMGQNWIRTPSTPGASSIADAAGSFSFWIPNYSKTDFHKSVHGEGASPFTQVADGLLGAVFAGKWRNTAAITAIDVAMDVGNWTTDSFVTVIGFLEEATAASITRGAGTLTVDFEGPEILDLTVVAGVNTFVFTNPVLGRTISINLTGGDGSSSISLPITAEKLEDNYAAGADAWLFVRCVDEAGPEYIVTIKDVI